MQSSKGQKPKNKEVLIMTYNDIKYAIPLNDVDCEAVEELTTSIKLNGWQGCPILVWGNNLVTGSHRLATLKKLENDGYDTEALGDVAEDVTDLIDAALSKYEAEHGYIPDIDYQDIGWLFADTWVEAYKDEIAEW